MTDLKDETVSLGDDLSKFEISNESAYSNYNEQTNPYHFYSKYAPEDEEEQKEGGDLN